MKNPTAPALMMLLASLSPLMAKDIPLVPFPQQVEMVKAPALSLKDGFTITCTSEFKDAADLFIYDIYRLYGLKGQAQKDKATITLQKNDSLAKEAYTVKVTPEGVVIQASNYPAMVMGLTSLMQMIDDKKMSIPSCAISDSPRYGFRSYLLDVARQRVEVETIRHIIDLCRWYKISFLQLHLTDDQLFTFESKIFPELKDFRHDKKWYYTQDELKELVEYATKRGIVIVPELETPGHSGALRRLMPDTFGNKWSIIDITSPKAIEATRKLIVEMMGIFHTSPYFHISADEVWLGGFDGSDEVKDFLAQSEGKLKNAHDIFLQYVVDLHEFVKSQGKTTIVWEGFGGTGSQQVQIPRDIIVDVWKMHFNRPDNLINNGYSVINASCQPIYITPGEACSQEQIYNWNPRRWEFPWHAGQGRTAPIQMPDDKQILGVQMCAWEMIDEEQLQVAHDRIPPLSENAWNDEKKQDYKDYLPRAQSADRKILNLIFPAKEERSGFMSECPYGTNHHRVHQFNESASVFFTPFNPEHTITYTTDRSYPTIESPQLTEAIQLKGDSLVKFGMFDKSGKLVAYKTVLYMLRQIDYEMEGLSPVRYQKNIKDFKFGFEDKVILTLKNYMPQTSLHYTVDGSAPTKDSPLYEGPITIDKNLRLQAASIDEQGHVKGHTFDAHYFKDSDTIK